MAYRHYFFTHNEKRRFDMDLYSYIQANIDKNWMIMHLHTRQTFRKRQNRRSAEEIHKKYFCRSIQELHSHDNYKVIPLQIFTLPRNFPDSALTGRLVSSFRTQMKEEVYKMKRLFAALLVLALFVCAVPAMAEEAAPRPRRSTCSCSSATAWATPR